MAASRTGLRERTRKLRVWNRRGFNLAVADIIDTPGEVTFCFIFCSSACWLDGSVRELQTVPYALLIQLSHL